MASHPILVEMMKFGVISAGLGAGEEICKWILSLCGVQLADPKAVADELRNQRDRAFAMNEITSLVNFLNKTYGEEWMANDEARSIFQSRVAVLTTL